MLTLEWADGTYAFRLPMKMRIELERIVGLHFAAIMPGEFQGGLGAISRRLMSGTPSIVDIYQVLRLALIGGGATAADAVRVCDLYIGTGDKPDEPSLIVAMQVVSDALYVPESLGVKKEPAAAGSATAETQD